MRVALLGVSAALAAIALSAPAQAQSFAGPGVQSHNGSGSSFSDEWQDRDDDRRDRRRRGDVFIGDWPRQGNSAWKSDSFNDWWHDQPHRSYPRWISSNQNCERLWQS